MKEQEYYSLWYDIANQSGHCSNIITNDSIDIWQRSIGNVVDFYGNVTFLVPVNRAEGGDCYMVGKIVQRRDGTKDVTVRSRDGSYVITSIKQLRKAGVMDRLLYT